MKEFLNKINGTVLIICISTAIYAQTAGTLTFNFTEVSKPTSATYGSQGKHVLAVWIQTNTGGFVKTKLFNAGSNNSNTSDHLPTWSVNAGGGTNTFTGCNKTDATTGATLTSFGTKTIVWDGKNVNGTSNGTVVADGTYKVTIQQTWNHGGSTTTRSFTFTKGPNADHQPSITADANFTAISLDWVPTNTTGVDETNSEIPEINVYPNPTTGMFNVDFNKATNIRVYNMLGAVLFEEKIEQVSAGTRTINLTNFANGLYFISVLNDGKSSNYKIISNK